MFHNKCKKCSQHVNCCTETNGWFLRCISSLLPVQLPRFWAWTRTSSLTGFQRENSKLCLSEHISQGSVSCCQEFNSGLCSGRQVLYLHFRADASCQHFQVQLFLCWKWTRMIFRLLFLARRREASIPQKSVLIVLLDEIHLQWEHELIKI